MSLERLVGVVGIAVLIAMYVVPYTLFYSSKDLSLYLYWFTVSAGYTAFAVYALRRVMQRSVGVRRVA